MEVTAEVLPDIARYFEQCDILPQQKVIGKTPEGKLIMTTRIAHQDQLFSSLRFWLSNVQTVSPVAEASALVTQLSQYISRVSQEINPITNNTF